jgi:NAD(P) transhydrogenase subunit alpha
MADLNDLKERVDTLLESAAAVSQETVALQEQMANSHHAVDPFVFALTVFVLACFIGYYVVWKVTPALHTPLMSVTNAISGIIVVGAVIALGPEGWGTSHVLGFIAIVIASINIFGGFVVTQRMLEMFKKKNR